MSDKVYERDREIYDEILKKYPDMKLVEGRPVDNQSGKYFYFFEEELRDARKELDSDRAALYITAAVTKELYIAD